MSVGFRCAMDVDKYQPPERIKPDLDNMVFIPAGETIIGTDPAKAEKFPESFGFKKAQYENETPLHQVSLKGFYIDRYEVTIGQYKDFLNNTGYFRTPKHWSEITSAGFMNNYPVAFVTWEDAAAYAQWAGKRLPAENEWEKAARGPEGNIYTWGNTYTQEQMKAFKRKMMPIGTVKFDRSPYGVIDLAGNVSEWTADWYLPYQGNRSYDSDYGHKYKVIKSGSNVPSGHYRLLQYTIRGAYRDVGLPFRRYKDVGFRCAVSE